MYDSCICIDESHDTTYVAEKYPITARKEHVCTECYDTIKVGEQYERAVAFGDYGISTFKTCRLCRRIRNSLFACGWFYGQIWDDIMYTYGVGPNGEVAKTRDELLGRGA
jgi:hypothetical protein